MCSDELLTDTPHGDVPIDLSGDISQTYVSRANDSGFADGDRMGIYIVDCINGQSGTLIDNGNHATNVTYTYNAEAGRWSASAPVYWRDQQTAIDIYGYYPFDNSMSSVSEHLFSVERDQSREGANGDMGGYEKSDFLWAKKENVQPTSNTIFLNFEHRLAGVKVALQQGEGFTGSEWEKVKRIVTVENTQRSAKIDLANGTATPNGSVGQIIAAPQGDDTWRAVAVPQIVDGGKALIGVTIDGTSYRYTREEATKLTQGKMHTFTLRIDKKEGGTYAVSLVAQSIEEWENDNASHNFEASAYTIIDCPLEGTFEECIKKSGKNCGEILNLKITGRLNDKDFYFISKKMNKLQGLNLYDVIPLMKVPSANNSDEKSIIKNKLIAKYLKLNSIQENVLYCDFGTMLSHIVLPKELVMFGGDFSGFKHNSTLVIPQSVRILTALGAYQGNIVLPDSLVVLETSNLQDACYRFRNVNIDFKFGNSVKYIGQIVGLCKGAFKIPENVEYIAERAFCNFGDNMTGEIRIPSQITEIPDETFQDISFANGTQLIMHDGIRKIGKQAFASSGRNLKITNRLVWPSQLISIGSAAFEYCDFAGGMDDLPDNLAFLGNRAFYNCKHIPKEIKLPLNLSEISDEVFENTDIEKIIMPSTIESVGNRAFYGCQNLTHVQLGKNVTDIGQEAFKYCQALKTITCLNPEPPKLGTGAFSGCDFDHLILEVPEKSVNLYRNAEGWKQFKYITAYHELAVSLSNITCLDKGVTRDMIVRSEGAWEVQSCPSWVHLSQTSSNIRSTEITVTVDESSSERQGEIIFKLKDNNYTTNCNIKQSVAATGEDKEIILQTASAGATPIPIFIVGDGYTAEDIANGTYLERMKEHVEHFFAIEPFKTYRNYFTVSTALVCSPDEGISSVRALVKNRFNTTYDPNGAQCGDNGYRCDYESLKRYAVNTASGINNGNIGNALIMVVMNQDNFAGDVWIDDFGTTIAFATNSHDTYPYDTRGLVQHYAGGKGFGRLAPEHIEHHDFLKGCSCSCCNGLERYKKGIVNGWYGNISLNGSMSTVPWSHLIFDPRYSDIVDVFEGGYRHARGAFRSENMSCMSHYIQYFNSYSRELIVRRIMELAGKAFDFEEFVRKDSREGLPQ